MQAAILDAAKQPFRLASVDRPTAKSGEVLVRIKASGVNPLDTKIRAGQAAHARHPLPAILGIDLAGTVEAVGPDVTAFRAGDDVYGMTGGVGGNQGSLAEYAAVDADLLAPKPSRLSMREAAALPLIVITAWEGLVDRANVQAGQMSMAAPAVSAMSRFRSRALSARRSSRPGRRKARPTSSNSARCQSTTPRRRSRTMSRAPLAAAALTSSTIPSVAQRSMHPSTRSSASVMS
jgi:hypothetical protein